MDVTIDHIVKIEPRIIKAEDGSHWLKLELFENKWKYTPICVFFPDGCSYAQVKELFVSMAETFDANLDEFLKEGE